MWPAQWICLLRSKYIALAYPKHQAICLISLSSWSSQCLVYQSLDSLAPPKLPMREWAVYTPPNKLVFIMIRANSSACPKQSSPWLKQSYWPMLSWWFLIYFERLTGVSFNKRTEIGHVPSLTLLMHGLQVCTFHPPFTSFFHVFWKD